MIFEDRSDAGRQLAGLLQDLYRKNKAVVYALPRGGVITGFEVASSMKAPLEIVVVRKISHPFNDEYAIGAVAEKSHLVLDETQLKDFDKLTIKTQIDKAVKEVERRRKVYMFNRKQVTAEGKTAFIVDDGIATGFTMQCAVKEVKSHMHPEKIVAAVPVAPLKEAEKLEERGIDLVCVKLEDGYFGSIGAYYRNFPAVSDIEVLEKMEARTQ